MRKFILLSLLFITFLAKSQNVQLFKGEVGNYPIAMVLNFDSLNVWGYYYYEKYGAPIRLGGSLKKGQWKLEESYPINGEWESNTGASFILDNQFNGTWKTKDKELEVKLSPVKEQISWKLFKQEVSLTHKFQNGSKQQYPMSVFWMVPERNLHRDLHATLLSEILGLE